MPISTLLPRLTGETTHRGQTPAGRPFGRAALLTAALFAGLAGVLTGAPAVAQTQTQPPAAPAQGQTPAAPESAGQVFGDWVQRCTSEPPPGASPPLAGKTDVCFLVQQVLDQNSQRPLLKVTIGFFGEERQAGAVIAMPLGVPLAHGIMISVDGAELGAVPFQVCHRDGCQAFFKLEDPSVAAFKAGSKAQARVQSTQGEGFNLPISLKGFTAGFGSLQ